MLKRILTAVDGKPRPLDMGYDEELEIHSAVSIVAPFTRAAYPRLATLWQQVRHLDRAGVRGALVECGVWRGGCAGMMALAHEKSCPHPVRPLHLFDSFEGLPEPSAVDGRPAREWVGKCAAPLTDCQRLIEREVCYPAALVHYHAGWFHQTLPVASTGPIALLRLDGDWYESTKICLEALYEHVLSGGIVVIDDYGHWQGCRKAVDEFLTGLSYRPMLHHVDYTCRYWLKP